MRSPVVIAECSGVDGSFTGEFCWCNTIKRGVYMMCVIVLSKAIRLLRKILGISEKRLVKKFSTNGSEQPLDEGMRLGCMRGRLDFVCTKYPQVRLPFVIKE